MNGSVSAFIAIMLFILTMVVGMVAGYQHDKNLIAAISDNGCASYQPPAPEHKQRIKNYDLSSLKSNK